MVPRWNPMQTLTILHNVLVLMEASHHMERACSRPSAPAEVCIQHQPQARAGAGKVPPAKNMMHWAAAVRITVPTHQATIQQEHLSRWALHAE